LFFINDGFEFVIPRFFLDAFVKFIVDGILSGDVGLDCVNLFEDLVLVIFVVAVEFIVICLDAGLQHLQHFFTHV
jgi:hypothetical protein